MEYSLAVGLRNASVSLHAGNIRVGIRIAQSRPRISIHRDERKTGEWHEEAKRHILHIPEVAHQLRHDRSADDRHDDET